MTAKKPSRKRLVEVKDADEAEKPVAAKPVISHRAILKEPDTTPETAANDDLPAKPVDKTTIEPLTAPEAEGKTVAQLAEEARARKATAEQPKPTPSAELAETPPEEAPAESEAQPADQPPEAVDTADAKSKAQAEHEAAVQKLIDSKQYFLPINTVEKRRTKRVVVLGVGLSLFLAAAWLNIALDAGLIQLGELKPVTHFFSN